MASVILDIIDYYGGVSKLATVLGVSQPAVSQWVAKGVPAARAIQIEALSGGRFKAYEIVQLNVNVNVNEKGITDE